MDYRLRFDEVKVKRIKHFKDASGKKKQKTKVFFQTLNPFNRNVEGFVKTREEIVREVNAEADAWMKSDKVD